MLCSFFYKRWICYSKRIIIFEFSTIKHSGNYYQYSDKEKIYFIFSNKNFELTNFELKIHEIANKLSWIAIGIYAKENLKKELIPYGFYSIDFYYSI